MRAILAGLLVVLMAECSLAADERAAKPAFKGMELYSWKPDAKDWHFSLLLGTNRLKSDAEIKMPENTIVGLEELKKRIAKLAEGESVFWRNLSKENVPDEMAKDLKKFCDGKKVNLKRILPQNITLNTTLDDRPQVLTENGP
jgi:hypothetical protein